MICLFIFMNLFVLVCICVPTFRGAEGGQKRAFRPIRTEVIGYCEFPDLDDGN